MAIPVENASISDSKKRCPSSKLLDTGSFSWPRSLALVKTCVYRHLIYFCMDYAIVLLSLVLCTVLREIFSLPLVLAAVVALVLPAVLNLSLGRGQVLAMGLLFLVVSTLSRELLSLLLLLAAVVAWFVLCLFQRQLRVVFNGAALTTPVLLLAVLTTPVLLLIGYKEIIFVAVAVGFAIVVLHAALDGFHD